jgi:predicted metalloprotease with PDZ domain
MYIVGDTERPARLTLDLPIGWSAAAGLKPTADPNTFTGATELMLDAPVMIGKFFSSDFVAGGIRHKIVIWSPRDAAAFDPKPLVDGIKKIAAEAIKSFGGPAYRNYVFMFRDGGEDGLEHMTSVNFGHDFSRGYDDLFQTIAHEYVHAWNLMDVRPKERVGLQYRFPDPTGVLWWNEGATIMFADYLLRRTGLPAEPATRIGRLETNTTRYLATPGYSLLSAEQASRGDTDPLSMGDNYASTHLQGELLAIMLDLEIQDLTEGRRSIVDVMRSLASKFDYRHGITNADIESSVRSVCGRCNVHNFFTKYIYNAGRIDFDHYLGLMGMRAEVTRAPAVDNDGKPMPDIRLSPMPSETNFRIRITNPNNAWGRAGLHTGDQLLTANGKPVSSWTELRTWLRTLKIGDVGHLKIERNGVPKTIDVPVTGYETTKVHITEIGNATPRQMKLRSAWSEAR